MLVFFTACSLAAFLRRLASRAAFLPASPLLPFLPLGFFVPAAKSKIYDPFCSNHHKHVVAEDLSLELYKLHTCLSFASSSACDEGAWSEATIAKIPFKTGIARVHTCAACDGVDGTYSEVK